MRWKMFIQEIQTIFSNFCDDICTVWQKKNLSCILEVTAICWYFNLYLNYMSFVQCHSSWVDWVSKIFPHCQMTFQQINNPKIVSEKRTCNCTNSKNACWKKSQNIRSLIKVQYINHRNLFESYKYRTKWI